MQIIKRISSGGVMSSK